MQNQVTAKVSESQAAAWLQADIFAAYRLIAALGNAIIEADRASMATPSIGRFAVLQDQVSNMRAEIDTLKAQIAWAIANPDAAIAYYLEN